MSYDEAKALKIPGYTIASIYCRKQLKGGGVAILVRDDIQFSEKSLSSIGVTEKLFEAVSINITYNEVLFNINCIYRSPESNHNYFIESMEKLLQLLSKNQISKFICADFNYNLMEVTNTTLNLTNLLTSFGYNKCFTEYSRVQGDSKTLIDNIFSNINDNLLSTQTENNVFSDHNAQIISHKFPVIKKYKESIKKRVFSEENINNFKYLLSKENWNKVYTESNNNHKFKIFQEIFLDLFNTAFPEKTIKSNKKVNRKSKTWVSENIVNEGIFLRELHKQRQISNDPQLKIRYNILKKSHEKNIKYTKKAFHQEKINNEPNKSKAMWNVIKNNTNIKNNSKQIPMKILNEDKKYLNNIKDIANGFNNEFIKSVNRLTSPLNTDTSTVQIKRYNENTIYLTPVTEDEILNIIGLVCSKKSSGKDEVPCNLIRDTAEYLVTILVYLVNISFENGHFPDQLKTAIVIPVYKKNDPSDIKNYRPIALLSVFSKIFEKAFQTRLSCFINRYNLLTTRQYGFCKNRSTQDAILSFYEKILNNFNNNLKLVGLFFDFSKAFDCINHKLLLKKLEVYGIRGKALTWIISYLNERKQIVKITQDRKVCLSESVDVLTGVPQGSVLGPLLFILFINDITDSIDDHRFLTLFADDTSAIITADNINVLSMYARKCVENICTWCESNGLVLNSQKTDLVFFSPIGVKQDFSVLVRAADKSICQSEAVKFLGLKLDKNLSWQKHTESLTKNLSSKNYAIIQLRELVNIDTLKIFYYGCVNSVLSYGILCWGNSSAVQKVFILQKRIIRSMFTLSYNTSCRPYFRQHGILTIYSMYILQAVCYVRKNINQFIKCNEINKYHTRTGNNLYVPAYRLTQVSKGPFIASIKIYNHLPQKLKDIDSFNSFKNSVKQLLLDHCFYSLDEFFNFHQNVV